MRDTALLGYGLLKKELLFLVRYRVNTLSYLVTIYAVFLAIFISGRQLGGQAFDDSLGAIIVGWFLVSMSHNAFNGVAHTLSREAAWGTLEQLYLTPSGFGSATSFIAVIRLLISFMWGTVLLALMLVTTGRSLSLDLVSVVPITVLTLMSIVGCGLMVGGAAILYKRISNMFNLMQFVILGLVAAPAGSVPVLKLLPLVQGSYLLQSVMNDGARIWEFPPGELAVLVGTGIGYLVVGYLTLDRLIALAKRRGVIGHY
jgi:ABC-2 type transport system permease protein